MWRGYGPVVERHEVVEVPEKRYYPPSPLKSRGLATSLHPLAPFTVPYLLTRGVRIVALLHCKKTLRVKETTPCFPQSHFLH